MEDQEKLLKWLTHYNPLKKKTGKIKDLNNGLSLLYLPIWYDYHDLKDFPKLYKDIDNIRRVLLDQNHLTKYSQIVIKYFKILDRKKPENKESNVLNSFLIELQNTKSGNDTLGLPEMKCWIKSKLENKPKRSFL